MKKIVLLSLFGAFFLVSKSEAQHLRFVTSFGVEQHWNVPYDVYYTVDHQYRGFNWVHARRVYNGGALFFEVILQRGDVFVEVNLDPYGRICNRVTRYNYPLHDHVCSDFCGFHNDYYVSHYTHCGGHSHHGHNHVGYRPRVIVYNNNHYDQSPGHGHGHAKHHDSGYGYGQNGDYHKKTGSSERIVYKKEYQNRRSGESIDTNSSKSRANVSGRSRNHGSAGGESRSRSNYVTYKSRSDHDSANNSRSRTNR